MSKLVCKYGLECYRLNPTHFDEFSHPDGHKMGSRKREINSDTAGGSSNKISKQDDENESAKISNRFNLFFSKVRGIDDKWNNPSLAMDISDILKLDAELLESSAQFNYMIDIEWLVSKYPSVSRSKPLLIVTGGVDVEMREEAHKFQNITLANAKLYISYGTHHTKMMILKYKHGLRVVIHTANLIEDDWSQKTQGIWLSPLFPKIDQPSIVEDSCTNFKTDFREYLKSYNLKPLDSLVEILDNYDFSEAKVFLVASSPGRHTGPNLHKWGHLKLRQVLKSDIDDEVDQTWPLLGQFSSIGSLGAKPDTWLTGEFKTSLSCCNSSSLTSSPKFHLVYPTVENVRTSLDGYAGGGSLPYSIQTARKQPYLKQFLHKWKSDSIGRTRAPPHIKTFARVNTSFTASAWFLITSSNLSKAAWGVFEKNGTQLMIRSYELGVLFIPKYFGLKHFSLENDDDEKIPFPYDLPPVPYASDDEPWIVDIPYTNEPDTHGYVYNPN